MSCFTLTLITFGIFCFNKKERLYFKFRSAIDEAREINHHGKAVKVGDDGDITFDKDLVSRDEKKQDKALK